jgi:hypothetical protein
VPRSLHRYLATAPADFVMMGYLRGSENSLVLLRSGSRLKSYILCDITQCIPLKVYRRFGRIYLHFHGGRVSKVRNQREARSKENWRCIPTKRRLVLNRVHSIISQTTELFITTGLRTSSPTYRPAVRSFGRPLFATIRLQDFSRPL